MDYPFNAIAAKRFCSEIDLFVYLHHPGLVEAFDRAPHDVLDDVLHVGGLAGGGSVAEQLGDLIALNAADWNVAIHGIPHHVKSLDALHRA